MDERMNELIKNYADQHGMSVSEVKEMVRRVQIFWGELKEKMTELIQALAEKIKEMVELVEGLEQSSERDYYIEWDTRKKSQVMNRKPKFVHARNRL